MSSKSRPEGFVVVGFLSGILFHWRVSLSEVVGVSARAFELRACVVFNSQSSELKGHRTYRQHRVWDVLMSVPGGSWGFLGTVTS